MNRVTVTVLLILLALAGCVSAVNTTSSPPNEHSDMH
jgi:hypothetical protein